MPKLQLATLFGLAGVSQQEDASARKLGVVLEWAMMCVAFWLPIEWYLEVRGTFSIPAAMLSDWLVWSAFFLETALITFLVKQKWRYLLSNWFNLLVILLVFPLWTVNSAEFGILRIVRLLVLFRIVFPWAGSVHRALTLNRIGLTLVTFLIATTLSGLILAMFDPSIGSPFIGIWWAWETVTTVGYGDVIPQTILGKVIAMVVMFLGITLFSIVTASISAYFVGKDQNEQIEMNAKKIKKLEKLLLQSDLTIDFSDVKMLDQFVSTLTKKEKQSLLDRLQ